MANTLDLYRSLSGMAPAPDIQRMRAQAQVLRQAKTPQGTMVGDRFAAPHWTQNLASTGSRVLGGFMERKATEQDQEYRSQLAQALRGTDAPEGVMAPGYEPPSRMERLEGIADENPYAQRLMLAQMMQGGAEPNWQKIEVPTEQGVQMGFVDMNAPNPEDTFRPMGEATQEQPDLPSSVQEYQFAQSQGYDGTYQDFQTQKAQAGADSTNVNVDYNAGELSPGWEAIDKDFAKNVYTPFKLGGTAADARKNIEQLRMAQQALEQSEDLTGPVIGSMPDFAMTFANPEAINTREAVEEVVQRNLREVLGAQFTEKEGERLISRAFNPRLPQEINKERLARLTKQMERGYQAKVDAINYFDENGTMRGFKGNLPSIDDFDSLIDQMDREHGVGNEEDITGNLTKAEQQELEELRKWARETGVNNGQ